MTMSTPRPALLSVLAWGSALAVSFLGVSPVAAEDPWEALEAVRRDLGDAGPTQAEFRQTYLPAGFSSGESESGRMALDLPRCLRWDYREPYAKSYLLCDNTAWAWAEGDPAGQRQELEPRREPGLDLLLLGTEDLRQRYRADARTEGEGADARLRLELEPLVPSAQLRRAVLVIDTGSRRLRRLETEDAEGNRTAFDIDAYAPLEEGVSFTPPEELEWQTP